MLRSGTRCISDSGRAARNVFAVAALAVGSVVAMLPAAAVPTDLMWLGPRVDYATAQLPLSVASGDLNGDGAADLVTSNSGDSTVSVLLGDGFGGFEPKADFPTGGYPNFVVVADLTGDALPDLATANSNDDSVSILRGLGDGRFGPKTDLPAGAVPRAVAVTDLNGDGAADLVTANSGGDTMSVLLANGSGSFAPKVDYATRSGPFAVVAADLNGDHHVDVIVANRYDRTVSVRHGNGTGRFGPRTSYATGPLPTSLGVANLNGDAIPDLVVATAGAETVSVHLGTPGGFAPMATFRIGLEPSAVALGDLDGDGATDIVTTDASSSNLTVLRGSGTGVFSELVTVPTGSQPVALTLEDLDGDAAPDVVTANIAANNVSVFHSTAPATVPGAPWIGLDTEPGPGFVRVSWTAPASDGGRPITAYVVTPVVGYFAFPPITFASDLTVQNVPVPPGFAYRFRVAAVNAIGVGPQSKSSYPASPLATVPGPPTIGAAVRGDASATLSWTAPSSNGGSAITGYVVTPYVGYFPLAPVTYASTATTQTVPGLINGVAYRFRVRAINAVGTGGFSTISNPL